MPFMTPTLSLEKIAAARAPGARRIDLQMVAETGSTNADLLKAAGQLHEPTLLIAERQTAGKGRAGRTWHAEPGATLTFSLAWKFALQPHALAGLPLVVGVAIAETLMQFGVDVQLKWPNDILLDGDKMAGVLIETTSSKGDNALWAVIGIGLNVLMPDSLVRRIDRPVAAASGLRERREVFLAALLDNLGVALALFEQHGFAVFSERWNRLHAYRGLPVEIIEQGRVLHSGVALGVDMEGRLLLDGSEGRIAVVAGDVSLRSAGG
jgi:BirA family biotin operon repressor/biotin-[acetyl-CoA-carboxylase] ligase